MSIGFDFGTANCSVSHMVNGAVQAIPLNGKSQYIPSTICAPTRESVTEYLFRHMNITPTDKVGEQLLSHAINANRIEGISLSAEDVRFGEDALEAYLDDPEYTYYIKSPKSFLGTTGLREGQLVFFEDLVCAMMANVKRNVESALDQAVSQAVIGRPINFHRLGGEASNHQAEKILKRAASRAGFSEVVFQFEPVAAGLDYEATLSAEQNVLVVDVGGGTTDCSLIRMGPAYFNNVERSETLLAHSGKMVGGNDIDIAIAFQRFMPEFGKGSNKLSGNQIPTSIYWDAIAINDVQAQKEFYSQENLRFLQELSREAVAPEKLERLIHVHKKTLGHSIVREAEKAKIVLSTKPYYAAEIDLLPEQLKIELRQDEIEEAITSPLRNIKSLVAEAVNLAGITPDVVYITGGSAHSPVIRAAIQSVLPDTPFVSGDYFGSVSAGLARWAQMCFD